MTPEQASGILRFLLPQLEMESKTTRKVMAAVPEDRADYKPDPKSMSARELVQHLTYVDMWFLEGILKGDFSGPQPESKATAIADIVAVYDQQIPALLAKLKELSGEQLAKRTEFFTMTAPLVTYVELLQKHSVHHRGQLSAYLRPMGAKVPSIYGGSADEPFTAEANA